MFGSGVMWRNLLRNESVVLAAGGSSVFGRGLRPLIASSVSVEKAQDVFLSVMRCLRSTVDKYIAND